MSQKGFTGAPISLVFEDADLKHVLYTFSILTNLSIVVHPGVQAKVTAQFDDTPWDQALATVLQRSGSDYILDGAVLRVGQPAQFAGETRVAGATSEEFTGDPVTLHFADTSLQEVVTVFSNLTGLEMILEPGAEALVTMSLNRMPWDQAFHICLTTHGLSYSLEEGVLTIHRRKGSEPALAPLSEEVGGVDTDVLKLPRISQIPIEEIKILGTISVSSDNIMAIAEGPSGRAYLIRPGTELGNSIVKEVLSDRVIFERADNPGQGETILVGAAQE